MAKEKLTPKSIKQAATTELSKLIKRIGQEQHTIDDAGIGITKFEALARLVWDRALGCTKKDPKTGAETVFHPDKTFIGMVFDRTEGKVAPAVSNDGNKKATLSSRIKEQSVKRLNQMSKEKKE